MANINKFGRNLTQKIDTLQRQIEEATPRPTTEPTSGPTGKAEYIGMLRAAQHNSNDHNFCHDLEKEIKFIKQQ